MTSSQALLQASISPSFSSLGFVDDFPSQASPQSARFQSIRYQSRKHQGLRLDVGQEDGRMGSALPLARQSEKANCTSTYWQASLGGAGVADEQDRQENYEFPSVPVGAMMVPMMKKGLGAYGGGVTLERSKLDLTQSQTKTVAQIDLGGGGRGNNNKISNGGGDGGDDGGDDDDYLGGEGDDEGDDDNGILRKVGMIELFDRATVEAVLQEWFKTIADLPAGLRRAMELGLISSAQLVRFISVECRPSLARAVSRLAPQGLSRAFIGRMIADPSFVFKAAMEQAITVGSATWWEVQQRGERLKDEWDLAAVNVLTLAACNLAIVWSLSPSRSYGTTARYDWQNMLQKLPNHIFDKSYPLREFNSVSRVSGFFYKAAELSLVGTVAGATSGALSNALVRIRKQHNGEYAPSVPVPAMSTSAPAMGAFLGLSGNLRYQLLNGADRFMQQNLNHISLAIFATTVLRVLNNRLGEPSRLTWLGLDRASAAQGEAQAQAYRRPSLVGGMPGLGAGGFPFALSLPSLDSLPFLPKGSGRSQGKKAAAEGQSTVSTSKRPRRKVKRKVSMAQ